jgi:hypothetical protein
VTEAVRRQDLAQLRADAQSRVEGCRGVLRYVADEPTADAAQLGRGGREHVCAVQHDASAGDSGTAALMRQQAGGGGRLARGRLAHQAQHLALVDDQRDVVVDVDAGGV